MSHALDESREELRRLKEAGDASVNEQKAQLKVADDIEKSRKTFADLELLRRLKEAKENVEAKEKETAASLERKETEWRDCDIRNKSLAERVTGFEREVAKLKTEKEKFSKEYQTQKNELEKRGSKNFTMIEHAQELDSNALKKSGIPHLAKAKHTPLKLSNAMIPVRNPAPATKKTPKSVHWPDLPPNDKTPEELQTIRYITPPLETPGKRGQQNGTGLSPARKGLEDTLIPDEKRMKFNFKDSSDCKTQ